jgi:hypothetical protein
MAHINAIKSRDQFRVWIMNSIDMNVNSNMPNLWEILNNLLLTQNHEYENLLNVVTQLSETGHKKLMQLLDTYLKMKEFMKKDSEIFFL